MDLSILKDRKCSKLPTRNFIERDPKLWGSISYETKIRCGLIKLWSICMAMAILLAKLETEEDVGKDLAGPSSQFSNIDFPEPA